MTRVEQLEKEVEKLTPDELAAFRSWFAEFGDTVTAVGCRVSIEDQVASLAKLEDGWLDDTTKRYDTRRLEWVARLLGGVVAAFGLPTPYIYPAADGIVRAEWSAAVAEVIAKINLESSSVDLLVVRGVDSVTEESIHLGEVGGESKLGRVLADILTVGDAA